ncbi:UNVERIFIED_CONTAM: hypothetical protein GTU68_043696, partial [Idotea baltica]|nr:hypothetical protein [Idotea baltica]
TTENPSVENTQNEKEAHVEAVDEAALTPHDEFDWEAGNNLAPPYTEEEFGRLENVYGGTFKTINDHEIINAVVASLTKSDVVLNIGFKSDGLIARTEFRDMPDLDTGHTVEVYVESKEDANGQLVLSRRKAKLVRAWDSIVDSYENEKVIKGNVVSKTKGGLIVNVSGLETFLPGSQIDVRPITDYDAYVGKTMEFKVVKINEAIKNAVVSHKALIESDLEEQRQQIISQLEKGQVLEGVIKNITDFGAFIDLGGVDGLLYITDISWGRVNHPSEVLENGQSINVVVLDFDDNKKRISLGLKQLQPHPWDVLEEEIKQGSNVKGKIVNIEDYGAFLEIKPGVEGLVHISEVSWSNQPINSREYFKLGQEYEAKVVTIDREERKMSLSVKQLSVDPWSNIAETFPIGSRHTGKVRNVTPYGVFVELQDGIGGMVHISDLSWTKRYAHPSEYTRPGEDIEVVVLEIDSENRKLTLGHKQIEEDPWDTFESIFPINAVHEGTVVKKDDKGAVIQMPYGVEAYCFNKHLKKVDGNAVSLDETIEFIVTEFSRDDKRIIVSHSEIERRASGGAAIPTPTEDRKGGDNKKKSSGGGKKRSDYVSRGGNDKSTLGDLDVLAELKRKMQEGDKNK